jgi:ribokinase
MLLVFGSINLDLSFHCPSLPLAGETMLCDSLRVSPGGKGANQAHAAQRYGVPTQLVGAVGDDAFAEPALQCLRDSGVDLGALQRLPGATGLASVGVDAQGENQILVAPGVNLALRHATVTDAMLRRCGALLVQMETDAAQNLALLERARQLGVCSLLNNAPAQDLSPRLLQALDVLIVNAHELQRSAQSCAISQGDAPDWLAELADRHALTVLLTLGAQGVAARYAGRTLHWPAHSVPVRDTTGAGDTFAGVFAAARCEGRELCDAVSRAVVAAGLACTRQGAQHAQPDRQEVEQQLALYATRRAALAGATAPWPAYPGIAIR